LAGKPLWDLQLGGPVRGIPIAYAVDGKQYGHRCWQRAVRLRPAVTT
jgi:hypothetical protein